MNSTLSTTLDQTEVANEADWALAGLPDSINATGLLAEDLEEYGGLTEIQTLILACVATVIPLFLGLLLILGVRMVWKKYKNHNTNSGYDNDGLRREDSCDAVKSSSFMQSAEELKASESQYSVLMPDECCYAAAAAAEPLQYNSPPNNRFGDTNKTNLNGSIITLTMKNNHLIVETEERVPGVCVAESVAGEAATVTGATADKPAVADYEYDDDEFDMEAEMLRREFREASLLANGCGGGDAVACPPASAAVLEPSCQTQVDLTADCRPTAATIAAVVPAHQLQRPPAADHSSGGSSSVDSRAAENVYAYRGNQSEYGTEDKRAKSGSGTGGPAVVKTPAGSNNNNNDDEYLVEQRLLGNGADGGSTTAVAVVASSTNICSPDALDGAATAGPATTASVAAVAQ